MGSNKSQVQISVEAMIFSRNILLNKFYVTKITIKFYGLTFQSIIKSFLLYGETASYFLVDIVLTQL